MTDEKQAALQKKLLLIRREAEERDAARRAARASYPYVDLQKTPVTLAALRLIPEADARAAEAATIEVKVHNVALAAVEPTSPAVQQIVKKLAEEKYVVKLFTASRSGLEQAWHLYEYAPAETKEITGKFELDPKRLEELTKKLTSFQAVRDEFSGTDLMTVHTTDLFQTILAGALANRASDIHFEAEETGAKIRFRLDGLLHDVFDRMPLKNYGSLVSRIKLLSGLKMNVTSEPQDGRFTIGLAAKEIEVRVSIIPSEFGETIVMRLLDPESIKANLADLGLRDDDLALVKRELAKPHGLILNTGPTGSGKTTTLYAFLRAIMNPEIKIITIEDPIEYRIAGIEQTQTDADAGYTFANGLRAILRQDPDAILVGEVRDRETADIALQASLTGHLVFSTLHTNDAVGAVPRLVDLGVKTATIGPAVTLIIAQRLVRVLCEHCKKPAAVSEELKQKIAAFLAGLPAHVNREPYAQYAVYEAAGCEQCSSFGYRGRRGIFEFLQTGPEFEELILREASGVALARFAHAQGMVPMQADGILKVLAGTTTFAEVEEATGPIVW